MKRSGDFVSRLTLEGFSSDEEENPAPVPRRRRLDLGAIRIPLLPATWTYSQWDYGSLFSLPACLARQYVRPDLWPYSAEEISPQERTLREIFRRVCPHRNAREFDLPARLIIIWAGFMAEAWIQPEPLQEEEDQ